MLEIRKASEEVSMQWIRILLSGEPGIGKTTLAMTSPTPILFDIDSGIRRVDPKFRSDNVSISSWDDILETSQDTRFIEGYESYVYDTGGKMIELLAEWVKAKNPKLGTGTGALTQQGWGVLLDEFRRFQKTIQSLKKNLIIVAHERETFEEGVRIIRPDIAGRSLGNIIRDMDLVGYMQSVDGFRTVSFDPTHTHYGKNTCKLPSMIYLEDFNEVNEKPLTDIIDKYTKISQSQDELTILYKKQVSELTKNINALSTIDGINDIVLDFKSKKDFIWDAKTIARNKLAEKSIELGFIFEKSIEKYIKQDVKPKAAIKKNKEVDKSNTSKPEKNKMTVIEENDYTNFVNKAKIAFSKGNNEESKLAYEEAYKIKPMPWIKGRITKLKDGN